MAENKKDLNELFTELEDVTKAMESEEVSLEDSLSLYEKGMKVLKECNDKLDKIEKSIIVLDEKGDIDE
ncbi:exodeoxyribonuclease VII small subunit [Ohessyouella blattaphilus]|uniref:Exodeoxyribonuclease 7 small subunit n=1 Tax=Ohessyouella blattaphilus TaxID=2949333 RepID=A0ABT1EKI0_9FIRM|nr:exodeoxyribonuclease VII small subunit [Ohessyouella blattaphilus]MCP1111224.1 exodeoxyribonuclease VII small subunit [Ohessyouella blattaphilus]MCR8564618.1 exodeoxyribonuclease VII small subunit [Ohessyouella blattaphilus]